MPLIHAYGEFWDPEHVDWSGRRMLGYTSKTMSAPRVDTDVWWQKGIYVLWGNWQVIYVGRATTQGIGGRLRRHWAGDQQRWDRFSWYGFRPIGSAGRLGKPSTHNVSPENAIATIESLMIAISPEALNRAQARIPGAKLVRQQKDADHLSLEGQLGAMQTQIDELTDQISALVAGL